MYVETLPVGQLKTNCYLVYKQYSGNCVIIDPGDDADYIQRKIADFDLKPQSIIATHGHFDHILAVNELKLAYDIPFFIHENDKFLVSRMRKSAKYYCDIDPGPHPAIDGFLEENNRFSKKGINFEIISIPGHTPGSVAFYDKKNKMIFSGDLLFAEGSFGRYDYSYSSRVDLEKSIDKILIFPKETLVYSGHGDTNTIKNIKYLYQKLNLGDVRK